MTVSQYIASWVRLEARVEWKVERCFEGIVVNGSDQVVGLTEYLSHALGKPLYFGYRSHVARQPEQHFIIIGLDH